MAGAAAVLGAVVMLAAACGSSHGGTSHAAGPGADTPGPASSLTIRIRPAPGTAQRRWTLICGSKAGGTLPHPETACAMLAHARHPFAPVPHGLMCSMTGSGPQTASITGNWYGTPVASFYARNDCWLAAPWNKIWKLLGQVNPGGPMVPASGAPPSG